MLGDLAIHSTLNLGSRQRWSPVSRHWTPGFDLRVLSVKSVVDKVAVGGVFLSTLVFLSLLSQQCCILTFIHLPSTLQRLKNW